MAIKTTTKVITNFGGRLTRIVNGDMDSGFAKFTSSWGYDPFSKPMNLSWMETPTDRTGSLTGAVVGVRERVESGNGQVYMVTNAAKFAKVGSTGSGPSVLATLSASSPTFTKGASLAFFGATEKVYMGLDDQVNSINFNGSSEALVGSKSSMVSGVNRPLIKFLGKLYFGNDTNIGEIDSTGTVTSYNKLSPGLPDGYHIKDMDITPDGNYMLITASTVPFTAFSPLPTDGNYPTGETQIFYWNGIDLGITSINTLNNVAGTALITNGQRQFRFVQEVFSASLLDVQEKIVSLYNNIAPFPQAVQASGNLIFFACREKDTASTTVASIYCYGSLDGEMPVGLYRLLRQSTTQASGVIYFVPVFILTQSRTTTIDSNAAISNSAGYSLFSFIDYAAAGGGTTVNKLYSFLVAPVTGEGLTVVAGVYETQTQMFSKRIGVAQIRVYTEPTIANNGFQIDLIGSDGNVITNGTFNYTFAAGSDETKLQGALERINFNPSMKTTYALGVRITNTGTANMTIKKIELDYTEEGK